MTIKHVFTKGAIYTDNDFAVRVLSRKGDFVSFKNLGNDKTFRRKVKVTYVSGESYEALNICKDWDKGFPVSFLVIARGILPEFTEQVIANAKHWYEMMYADDNSQPELPATADDAISANDNDNALASQPAAVANAESSQTEALYMDDSFSDAPGDNSECARNQDFPVDFPNSMPDDNPGFTIWSADNGSFVFPYKSNKQNLSLSYTARLVHLELNDGNTKNYQGD